MDSDGHCEGTKELFLMALYDQLTVEEQCPPEPEWLPARDNLHPA